MTSPTLLSLADRVSSLTTACRETDYLICEAVHPFLAQYGYQRTEGDSGYYSATPSMLGGEKVGPASNYTASLDSAMTLVPEGWFGGVPIHRNANAWLRASNDSPIIYGEGKTQVLKLLSAILRARSALEASHD